MIPKSFISSLVSQCDIEDIISTYVNVKKAGRNTKALCPFHSEKTPSFVIYPDTQSFFCFGCGAGGDVISFIMRIENLEYAEAVRFLASRMGVTVPEDGQDDVVAKQKQRIYAINKETAMFFHKCLKSKLGIDGINYFRSRGLSDKTITSYGLGYAPNSWDTLTNYLSSKGFSKEEQILACVAVKGKSGNIYDQFRNRVMFPIIDIRGNIIGFGGRVLDNSKPKYLNTPDTPVFKKSKNLFSLNFAKTEIKDTIILAEGYMDVIAINSSGIKNVVATLGTALTSEQARLIAKYASNVVIAYDSDEAGQKATHRAVNLLSEAGVKTKVLKMAGAKDPDEYIKKFGVKRFEMLVNGAEDVIDYELNSLKSNVDLTNAEGKIAYLKKAVEIISDISNPIEREVYAGNIAKETGTMIDTVLSQAKLLYKKKYKSQQNKEWNQIQQFSEIRKDRVNPQKINNLKEAKAEEGIISYICKNPESIDNIIKKITPNDFTTDFNRRVFEELVAMSQRGNDIKISLLGENLSHEEMSTVAKIIADNDNLINSEEIVDEFVKILLTAKDRLSKDDIISRDVSDLEEYRKKLLEKKK